MAFSEETYIKIFRYLENDLSPQERADFEQEINASEELAREVALQREMDELLADSPENALRKNLATLSQQAEDKGPPGGFLNYFLWGIPLLLVAAAAWWFLSPDDSNSISGLSDAEVTSPTTAPASSAADTSTSLSFVDSAAIPIDTNSLTDASSPVDISSEVGEDADVGLSRRSVGSGGQGGSTTAANKTPDQLSEKNPQDSFGTSKALDSLLDTPKELSPELTLDTKVSAQVGPPPQLVPITKLEEQIGEPINIYGFILQAEQKQEELVRLNAPRGPVSFRFAGAILPDSNYFNPADTSVAEQFATFLQEYNFELQLYSNDEAAFEAAQPVYSSMPINMNLTPNQIRSSFEVGITINLNAGLHYYLIRSISDGKIFFVDKFTVLP